MQNTMQKAEQTCASPGGGARNRHLWLDKAAVLSDAGRENGALALITQAFEDKAFADEYHRKGQSLLDGLPG